jgi:hypothetical protein
MFHLSFHLTSLTLLPLHFPTRSKTSQRLIRPHNIILSQRFQIQPPLATTNLNHLNLSRIGLNLPPFQTPLQVALINSSNRPTFLPLKFPLLSMNCIRLNLNNTRCHHSNTRCQILQLLMIKAQWPDLVDRLSSRWRDQLATTWDLLMIRGRPKINMRENRTFRGG